MDAAQEFLQIAGETEKEILAIWPDTNIGSRLFWAAIDLGGSLAAVSMIEKLETLQGLAELQAVLQIESYDVLEAAAVGLAARSAVSAIDLCAAAAWRIEPDTELPTGWAEADFGWISEKRQRSRLLPIHKEWVDTVTGDEWSLMSKCRHQATHGTFRRTVKLSAGSPRQPNSEFDVGGSMHQADGLVRHFAQNAESWFRQFCAIKYV